MIYTNIGQVTIMAVAFLMVFTAFQTCQNFASKVLNDYGFDSIGFTSVATLYLVFAFFSFFSKSIVTKIGSTKTAMSLGAMCYSMWIVCFLLPAFYAQFKESDPDKLSSWYLNVSFIKFMLVFTAAINGAGAGVLWVAQGAYLAECACDSNKGFFNSYF